MDLPTHHSGDTLPGPAGLIEIHFDPVPERAAGDPVAVVCHPHSQFGGNLHNKVTHMVARAFQGMGVATLRFNFRGVGHSEGSFDQGRGEQQDLLAAVVWLRRRFPDAPLWLAGFSFGSAVALAAWRDAGAARLLLVAPPVEHDYFPSTANGDPEVTAIPWLVIMGGADEVVTPSAVSRWVAARPHPPEYRYLDEASHFFHRRLIDLRGAVQQAWSA